MRYAGLAFIVVAVMAVTLAVVASNHWQSKKGNPDGMMLIKADSNRLYADVSNEETRVKASFTVQAPLVMCGKLEPLSHGSKVYRGPDKSLAEKCFRPGRTIIIQTDGTVWTER